MGLKQWWARVTGGSDSPHGSDGSDGRPGDWADIPAPPPVPTEGDIVASLDSVRELAAAGAVPAAVSSRLRRVDATIRETLPRLRNLGMGSIDAYSVMATATDYLPEALGGYLRLPRDWADSRPIDNGKSSLLLLIDQLDLLGATMDRIFDAVNASDAQALIAHGRFLQEKFGTASTGGQLNLGTGSPPVGAPPDTPSSQPTGPLAGPPSPLPPPQRNTLDLEDT